MSREVLAPTVENVADGKGDPHQVYQHPAFGTMTLTHVQGGPRTLFASDVPSLGCVRIEVRGAELHRDLSHDWVSPVGHSTVMVLEMSHAQFAEFITSAGRANGVPVTLRRVPKTPAVGVPEIEPLGTKQETFKREIREQAAKRIERMQSHVQRLTALIESGKVSKKDLREIARAMDIELGNLPGNLEYVVESAEEALDEATAAARVEVEAFVQATARSLGLQSLHRLGETQAGTASLPLASPIEDTAT